MSRSIFGLSLSPVLAWCLAHPERFAVPCTVLPRRKSLFAARVHGVNLRRGDLLALHAVTSCEEWHLRRAALAVREAMDTTVPTHAEPYRALAGRVVAVATLVGCTTRLRNQTGNTDPWRTAGLRAAFSAHDGAWWAELADVHVLSSPVECAGDVGLWSLPHHVAVATMDQVRALEARGRAA